MGNCASYTFCAVFTNHDDWVFRNDVTLSSHTQDRRGRVLAPHLPKPGSRVSLFLGFMRYLVHSGDPSKALERSPSV